MTDEQIDELACDFDIYGYEGPEQANLYRFVRAILAARPAPAGPVVAYQRVSLISGESTGLFEAGEDPELRSEKLVPLVAAQPAPDLKDAS